MGSGQPDPFAADVVHVGEDRCNGADIAGRPHLPYSRVEMLDDELVHSLVDGKYARGGWAELRLKLGFARGHDSSLPPPSYRSGSATLRQSPTHEGRSLGSLFRDAAAWIVEGLCRLIEGLCAIVEGLCSVVEGLCRAEIHLSASAAT